MTDTSYQFFLPPYTVDEQSIAIVNVDARNVRGYPACPLRRATGLGRYANTKLLSHAALVPYDPQAHKLASTAVTSLSGYPRSL